MSIWFKYLLRYYENNKLSACRSTGTIVYVRRYTRGLLRIIYIGWTEDVCVCADVGVSSVVRRRLSCWRLTAAAPTRGRRPPTTLYIWRTMIWSGEVNGRARRGWAWAVIDPYWRWNVDQWARAAKFAAESARSARCAGRTELRPRAHHFHSSTTRLQLCSQWNLTF